MKKTPKQIRIRSYIILGIGLLIGLLGIARNEQVAVIIIGLLIVLSSGIYHVIVVEKK